MNRQLSKILLFIFLLVVCQKSQALVVLQYHHISDITPKSTSLSPVLFKQHLDYLFNNHFQVLSLEQVVNHLKYNKPFPDKAVLITFDDGYISIYDTAFALLKNKQFAFTVFVNTQPLTQNLRGMMTWSQLEEISKQKATIANHSVSHSHLTERLKNETLESWKIRVTNEIISAQQLLLTHLKTDIKVFAYPYGEFNHELKFILKDLGYLAFGQQSGAINNKSDLQGLARFPFGGNYGDMDDFIVKVNSLALPISNIQLLGEQGELLSDHVLENINRRPKLKIKLEENFKELALNCYLSGEGEIDKTISEGSFIFQSKNDLPLGRSRFNCTAKSQQANRVYWFSQPWLRID
jgi:poly-beta-1,6-N-acetyl-D-glucosamine N-deacetylase